MNSIDPMIYSYLNALNFISNSKFFQTKSHSMMARIFTRPKAFSSPSSSTPADDEMEVNGWSTRTMRLFGFEFEMCQRIPTVQMRARNPREPGKFSLGFRMEDGDFTLDFSPLLRGIFAENFLDFYVLRYYIRGGPCSDG